MKKICLPVEGMTCAACVSRVEKIVSKFDGVKNVSVNFATEKLSLELEKDDAVLGKIKSAVADAGYNLILDSIDNSENNNLPSAREDDKRYIELRKRFLAYFGLYNSCLCN